MYIVFSLEQIIELARWVLVEGLSLDEWELTILELKLWNKRRWFTKA